MNEESNILEICRNIIKSALDSRELEYTEERMDSDDYSAYKFTLLWEDDYQKETDIAVLPDGSCFISNFYFGIVVPKWNLAAACVKINEINRSSILPKWTINKENTILSSYWFQMSISEDPNSFYRKFSESRLFNGDELDAIKQIAKSPAEIHDSIELNLDEKDNILKNQKANTKTSLSNTMGSDILDLLS